MINQMSSSMRNFMEAYSAVHNKEAKEEFYSHKDEISEMDFSLINQTELDDIAEEVLEELFEEGYSVEQCEAIFEEVLTEARVTYGSDTESPRAKKMSAVKSSLEGAMGKVKEKAAKGAVKSYGAYRSAKQSATDKANRLKQSASNASAVTMRKAKDAKAGIKSGIKGMIRKAAKKVGDAANKVSNRMSEGTVRRDIRDIYQAIYEKRANKDYDGDGEVESGKDEYFGSRDKAIKKAMGKKGKCESCGGKGCEKCDGMSEEYLDEMGKSDAGVRSRMNIPGYEPPTNWDPKANNGRGATVSPKQAKKRYRKSLRQEELEHIDEADSLAAMAARREKRLAAQRKKMGTSSTGQDFGHDYGISSAERKKRQQAEFDKFVGKKTKKESVQFSEKELKAIQAKVDAWDLDEAQMARNNPEKYERDSRKSETSGQKAERNVRGRLKTMDPDKAEAMKKQMRAVGLNV